MNINTVKTKWRENELKQNTHILETENGLILVDAGISLKDVQTISHKPVLAVLITHSHYDHILAVEEYDKAGISIYCTKEQVNAMQDEVLNVTALLAQPQQFNIRHFIQIEDNEELEIDNVKIKCIATPGHSRDSVCYLINGDLFSGDTIFSIAIGRTDFRDSSNEQMIKSLKKLQALDFDKVYAGHGRVSDKQEQMKNIAYYIKLLEDRLEI